MLELTITSARQWSPDIAATVGAWRISPRSIIGKAPRSLICNATASWLFRRSLSGQAACGRHPTNGKEAGSVRRLLVRFQVCSRVRWSDWSLVTIARDGVITMISGFLTSVISSLRPRQHSQTPYVDYWFLPSSTPAFLAAKRFIKRTNRVSTDVADKHARYISEICYLVRRSRRSRMN